MDFLLPCLYVLYIDSKERTFIRLAYIQVSNLGLGLGFIFVTF